MEWCWCWCHSHTAHMMQYDYTHHCLISPCYSKCYNSLQKLHIHCGALWLSGSVCALQERDCRFDHWLGWCCALGQSLYPHVHPLDPGVKVGTWWNQGAYTIPWWNRESLCVWLVLSAKSCGCQAVCSPGSWDGSCDQGVIVYSQESSACTGYWTKNLHLY